MAMLMSDRTFFSETQPIELDLFSLPPTQTAVERTYLQECRPVSPLAGGTSPIEFHISGQNGLEYIDLRRSSLYVKAKIVHADGTNLDEQEECAPVNLLIHSMWSQLDVWLQGKLINSTTNHYPYKAMIHTLLNTNEVDRKTKLSTQMFYKDTQEHFDETNPFGRNEGLSKRYDLTSDSKTFDLESDLLHDLFQLKRYILNQVDVQVKLYRSNPNFFLMSSVKDKMYSLQIEDIALKIMKVCVNPGIILGHSEALSNTTAKYPYKRTEVKLFSIPTGQVSFVWDNIFQGVRPNKVIIGFVSSDAVTGDLEKNPFRFTNFNLTQIALFCDGRSVAESGPMKLQFNKTNGQTFISAFANLFRSTGSWVSEGVDNLSCIDFSRQEFDDGYTLYAFPLEPVFGRNDGQSFLTLQKQGSLRLEAQFGSPLTESVTCVCYAEFGALFEIEKSRNIIV